MRIRPLLPLLLLPLLFSGCAKRKKVPRTPPAPGKYVETGIASWYGDPYHGRTTSSGEIYDMEKFTAAHRTLPFDTWVRVENLSNHRKVEVRINDRGPFAHGRIIDLSRAAARRIGMLGPGTAKVRLISVRAPEREESTSRPPPAGQETPSAPASRPTPMPTPPPASAPASRPSPMPTPPPASAPARAPAPRELLAVQVGAFSDRARAERLRQEMERRYGVARLVERQGSPTIWQVLVGEQADAAKAAALAKELQREFPGTFVVHLNAK